MNEFDPKIHHRRSIRLKGYDYARDGAYFVTIVTWQREMLFGEVVDGVMVLNDMGEIVREEWERAPIVRPYIELGAYVVMPNHIHGILIFNVGAVIGQFKSIVTKRINTLHNSPGVPVWQRNYYDRIIR
ncbi:MAG: transposase, partial [Anaerolineae bacterium]|nr:transposase [Anaerolineae bacterium]